ncbi:unnamed protein product [Brassicogethes aeneus]|uniref:Pre-rRNA-processing protein TSR1 homolog n=1 Tax=Brassicogethes aeneus TaxID=1431903 RepID=A0A9P0FI70_BRAAE|nr:unnamed protein product [Brassicogethes aeneus]
MGLEKGIAHRSGAFKQSNKEHKHGRHRSKGSLAQTNKGKVSVKKQTKRNKHVLTRDERRHQADQIRQNKRDDLLARKRSLGSIASAPFLVCILPLNKDIDPNSVLNLLTQCDEQAVVHKSPTGVTHIFLPRFKQKFSFIIPQMDNMLALLDVLKICDTVLFLVSAACGVDDDTVIDKWGHNTLTACFAQGLPTPVVALTDLESIGQVKHKTDIKQQIQKLIENWLPKETLVVLDKNPQGLNLLRKIGGQKKRNVFYRDRRPHLYSEDVTFVPNPEGTLGTLKVTGYLRGTPLSVNSLVHVPGLGDFQISQIDAPCDPFKVEKSRNNNAMEDDSTVVRVLDRCNPSLQESLDAENVPDPMDDEQTWPTNEEIKMAEKEQKQRKRRVPAGWSDYQAAWIPEEDDDFVSDASDDDDEDNSDKDYMDAMSEERSDVDADERSEMQSVAESEVPVSDDKYDQQMDLMGEKEALKKIKAAKSDVMFPDEIDTPMDMLAKDRFTKYRGLESFRTSPWDVSENLPSDYTRIFQFKNFDRTKKRILKEQEDVDGAMPGWYITVYVQNVSQLLWSTFKQTEAPVVLMGLFPNEHKMTVVNTVLKRTPYYNFPIKSKERLIFQCGFRRFAVNPIFSNHTNGQKHKFERFFQPDSTSVATFYAPIQFPPAPVLCFKEVNGNLTLVATGNLLSCNPDRLVIKRIVLSGHPFKINKRSAVIRFMFFNREDIEYFKACKLRTKMGRIGHIKEPLGTHGHMKCVFDGQLKSQDTILLNLYKRVFPKWTYEELVVSCANNDTMETL